MANIFANVSFDMSSVDLSKLSTGYVASSFTKGMNAFYHGVTYADVLKVDWSDNSGYYSSVFGGTGIRVATSGAVTAGTLTGYLETDYFSGSTPNVVRWGIEGASIPAKSIFAAALTSGTSDEIAIFNKALAGNDTISGSEYVDRLFALGGNDVINGNGGDDRIFGGAGNDTLNGGAGSDNIQGEAGNDTLNGGDGYDNLFGGLGNDILTGGAGADGFVFVDALKANIDRITDFSHADSDTIWLSNTIFRAISGGTLVDGSGVLTSDAFYAGTAAHDATDRIIYNPTTGALFYDADGNGKGAAVQFATLNTNSGITYNDIHIFTYS